MFLIAISINFVVKKQSIPFSLFYKDYLSRFFKINL